VDREGDSIFPNSPFTIGREDSCDLPGQIGSESVTFNVNIQLEICEAECPDSCDSQACRVIDPIRFSCQRSRGTDRDVPASTTPYRFEVRAIVSIPSRDVTCTDPAADCIAVPGPRERLVRAGLVTDLQVYQVVLDMQQGARDGALDLEECGCV
jgi:hypothetical protein